MNARDIVEEATDIFVMSDSFIRIKELIDNEKSTIDDIADVILFDPALSATILKLANSSFFNYPGKIDTISKAMLVLGISEVYNLVIAYFTSDAFKQLEGDIDFLDDFWERSVDCALLIKFFGSHLNIANVERLFILGLLHNLGELVVHQFAKEQHQEYLATDPNILPWVRQQSMFGFTFGECTAELMRFWQLPYNLIEPVNSQDSDAFEYMSDESKLLFLAKRIMTLEHMGGQTAISRVLTEEQAKMFNLKDNVVDAAMNFCDLERLSILALLKPSSVNIY